MNIQRKMQPYEMKEIIRKLRNDPESGDVILASKGYSVRAHRIVLAVSSAFLRDIMLDVPANAEGTTIIVPDIDGSLLDSFLSLIYTGEVTITTPDMRKFLDFITALGIKGNLCFQAICDEAQLVEANNSKDLDLHDETTNTNNIAANNSKYVDLHDETTNTNNIAVNNSKYLDLHDEATNTNNIAANNSKYLDFHVETTNSNNIYSSDHIYHISKSINTNEYNLIDNPENTRVEHIGELDNTIKSYSENFEIDGGLVTFDIDNVESFIEISDDSEYVHHSSTSVPLNQLELNAIEQSVASKETNEPAQQSFYTNVMAIENSTASSILPNESFSTSRYITPTRRNEVLELAVQLVLKRKLSLDAAAKKYEIPPNVLWLELKNRRYLLKNYENPLIALAVERMKNGDSLKRINQDLGIPLSTLYRRKLRLVQQGYLSDYTSLNKRGPESKIHWREKLNKAIHACVHDGMTQSYAADKFDVPKSTLWRHLRKRLADAKNLFKKDENDPYLKFTKF